MIAEELKNSGKPEEIAKKISIGKLNKFKEDNSLLSQAWIMEPKKKVKDIINVDKKEAIELLEKSNGSVKIACLIKLCELMNDVSVISESHCITTTIIKSPNTISISNKFK